MSPGVRILVADDDADMRAWLRVALEPIQADVEEAVDGSDLLCALAESEPYNLVITDVRMPGLYGWQALASARTAGVKTPFLVITAFPEDARVAATLGQVERAWLLAKPLHRNTFLEHAGALLVEATAEHIACAACRSRVEVVVGADGVAFCSECLDSAREASLPEAYGELGVGD